MKRPKLQHLGSLLLAGVATSFMAGAPAGAADELPAVDSDGLHLLKDTRARIVYAKPGVSLAPYTKVMLLDCYVEFVADWQKDYNLDQIGLQGRVSDKDAERIKQGLAAEFREVFTKELTDAGHPVVDEPAKDVLLLRPALINVDVAAPDLLEPGRSRVYIESAGAITLYLEIYDSATSTLLARVVDPQADDRGFAQAATRVTNKSAADRILREWARLLAAHLGTTQAETAAR